MRTVHPPCHGPGRIESAVHLAVFILTLLAGQSIAHAYQSATQTTEPRTLHPLIPGFQNSR